MHAPDNPHSSSRRLERNNQVIRQWELLLALAAHPQTVVELSQRLSTTVRTIYRDLDALQAARFALYNERHSDGAVRWHVLDVIAVPARRAA